ISQEEIDRRVRKVLRAKEWMGLDQWKSVKTEHLVEDLNLGSARYLNQQLVESSITLLRNKENVLPVRDLAAEKIAFLAIGATEETSFQQALSRYVEADQFYLSKEADIGEIDSLVKELKSYTKVIAGIHGLSLGASVRNFGITAEMRFFLKQLIREVPAFVALFGNVYSLNEFDNISDAEALLVAYQES